MSSNLIQVASGAVQVGRAGDVLACLLGSCVGIALVWPQGRCCGLAHCLLPDSNEGAWAMNARYVNHALPSLMSMMALRQKDLDQVEVILTGGANMLGAAGMSSGVGPLNIEAAHRSIAAHGLQVAQRDVGGRRGRTLRIDCSTYRVSIASVDRHPQESHHASL